MRRLRTASLSLLTVVAATLAWGMPAAAAVDRHARVSDSSPYEPGCNGAHQSGTVYPDSEVEPYVAVNPTRPRNIVAVWQQDRWSNGSANGILAGYSTDGGRTWQRSVSPPFSHCAGGNERNGGDYERASDPWVTFSPDGDAYFMSLSSNDSNDTNAMLVARSQDGGRTWGPIHTLIRDSGGPFNDKNSMTADPTDSRYVYAVWDRLSTNDNGNFIGPTYFTRTTNGGASWEEPRPIYNPGPGSQTIGNQIAVLPDGTLINVANVILDGNLNVAVLRSTDHGQTWSDPAFVSGLGTIGVVDPRDGAPVRTGDIIPEIAVDPRAGHDNVYIVWQDARFTGYQADQVAFSRSTDGGRHWSPPKRVSAPGNTQAFTPQVHVDARGRVAVTYYDFTYDTTSSAPLQTDQWVTRSANQGRSFAARERLTRRSYDMRDAPVARGFFVGDYAGLDGVRNSAYSLLISTRTPPQTEPTDAYSARVHGGVRGGHATGRSHVLDKTRVAHAQTSDRTPGHVPAGEPTTRH